MELSVPDGIIIDGGSRKEVGDGSVKWVLNGRKGEYLLQYIIDGTKYNKEVLITEENRYIEPLKRIKGGVVKSIEVVHNEKKVLNLFGWKVGWLGVYIMFSIFFSIVIRKVIKVY